MNRYPLDWPPGYPRTAARDRSPGKQYGNTLTIEKTIKGLRREIELMGGTDLIVSSNLRYRNDGYPYSQQPKTDDPGIAVYFNLKKKPMVMACDAYVRNEFNIRALALTIEAMRGIERWGCSQAMERAFSGFMALPPAIAMGPAPAREWWLVLGVDPGDPIDHIESAYRTLAKEHHPDRGGSQARMSEITQAYMGFRFARKEERRA